MPRSMLLLRRGTSTVRLMEDFCSSESALSLSLKITIALDGEGSRSYLRFL